MMHINSKYILSVLTLVLFFGFFSSLAYGQQLGVVEKSNETKQIGNQVYYLHIVAKGNTLYSLSKAYKVSMEEIKEANSGLEYELKLGSVILIPKAKEEVAVLSSTRISNENYFYHVVKQGESLFGIAKIFGVKAEDLQRINGLSSTSISPGFHLKIPELELEVIETQKTAEPQQVSDKKDRYFEHTVKPEETLYSIAKLYGIGLETLKYINNFTSNDIHPGQILFIPNALKDRQAQENRTYVIHQVQPKEGLYGIARQYGIRVEQIKAINPGLTDAIAIGQEIKIPRNPNTKGYIEHRVTDRKEKLSNIARDYEVSVNNLRELNPDASNKVRMGETVYIPVDFVDQKSDTINGYQPIIEEQVPKGVEVFTRDKSRVFNIAMMLPLYLNEVDSMQRLDMRKVFAKKKDFKAFRYLEFYEGAKIAADSLRELGMKLNFMVYDINDNDVETALILQDPALRKTDLIISLLFSRSFALVSNFSKENGIPLVNATSKRRQIIYENPYVFKLSPNPEAMYKRVADFISENLPNSNTIIVRNNPYQLSNEYNFLYELLQQKLKPKAPISNTMALQRVDALMKGKKPAFLDTLQYKLVNGDNLFLLKDMIDRPYDTTWVNNTIKTVIYSNDSLRGIMQQASFLRDNLVIALGSNEVFAIELFTKLNFVRDSLNIKVIGLPDWQNYSNLDVDYSQAFKLRVSSEDFVDYNSPAARRFEYQFNKTFNKVPELDTYSYLGYDASFYFLQALFLLGDDWLDRVSEFQIPLLQNQFQFERQNEGGFENTYWNLYRQENYQYKLEK